MWPLSARGGTRWRCAGILAAVQARQRRSALLLPTGLRLHLEQLIAQLRRRLEIQIGGCVAHLRLEIRDQRRQVVGAVVRAGFRDPPAFFLFALLTLGARVGDAGDEPHLVDALDDARRYDSVFVVVRLLQLAATARLLDAPLHRARHLVGVED